MTSTTETPPGTGLDDTDDEHQLTVQLTVTEEVTHTFTSTFYLTAEEADEVAGLNDDELAGWLEDNDELWIDDLDPTGAGASLEVNERTVDEATRVSPAASATETEH